MYTTIKVSEELKRKLDDMKILDSETYEEVIEDLIEDHLSLNPKFAESVEQARKEIKEGKSITLAQLKGRMKHV
ncbi:MAG: hypothetical protein AB1529_07535 [Candidatus Micrarchaeota archaeon]